MIVRLTPATIDLNTPQIYCSCLAAYNSGYLHGTSIDATQDPEGIYQEIQQMLSISPVADTEACEDWAIHDYQGFMSITLHEYESIERVSALAQAIEEHGQAIALYINYLGFDDIEEAVTAFQDNYCGCFESAEDYAQDYYEQTGQLQAIEEAGLNSFYINWKAIAHDWECSGDFLFLEESGNEIHTFHNH
jgi:antirestriction protein